MRKLRRKDKKDDKKGRGKPVYNSEGILLGYADETGNLIREDTSLAKDVEGMYMCHSVFNPHKYTPQDTRLAVERAKETTGGCLQRKYGWVNFYGVEEHTYPKRLRPYAHTPSGRERS